jgi:Bacterial protein of unknown function (DUF916)
MRRLLLILVAAVVLAPTAAAATDSPVFGLRAVGPKSGYFVYTAVPGAARTGSVIVSNVGKTAGSVRLFTADATTGQTTGTVYKTDAAPTQSGTWTTLAQTSLTLAPGTHRKVAFTVHVPADAQPGQWVSGIAVEAKNASTSQQSGQKARVQIKVREVTIVAVQVNVPGPPVVQFTLGNVTTGGSKGFQKVFLHVSNVGNVLAKPTGAVTIYTAGGALVQTLPFKMDTFLPQTSIDYPILLKKALPAGDYQASVRLRVPGFASGAAKVVTSSPSFTVSDADVKQVFSSSQPTQAPPTATTSSSSSSSSSLPTWAYAAIGAAILAVLVLLVVLLLRRRGRKTPMPATPTTVVQLPPEPAPEPEPEPEAAPETAPPPEPVPGPEPGSDPGACVPYHYWEVDYEHGVHGSDGQWRFPHRCRSCGLEMLARDVTDASEQAAALRP